MSNKKNNMRSAPAGHKRVSVNKPKVTLFISAAIAVLAYAGSKHTGSTVIAGLLMALYFLARIVMTGGYINISFSFKKTNGGTFCMSLLSAIGFGFATLIEAAKHLNDHISFWEVTDRSSSVISFMISLSLAIAFFFLGLCLVRAGDMATKVDGILLLVLSYPYMCRMLNDWSSMTGRRLYKVLELFANNVFISGIESLQARYATLSFVIAFMLFAVAAISIPNKKASI